MNVFEMINVDKIINNVVDENTKKKNYDELVESIIYTLHTNYKQHTLNTK